MFLARYTRQQLRRDAGSVILCNSYPKSGTDLLYQILGAIPGLRLWNNVVAVQSMSGVMNAPQHIRWKLGSMPSGSVVRSHLPHSPEVLRIVKQGEYKRFFIYRDLRDVALSRAHFVRNESRHFLHAVHRDHLASDRDRLIA